MSNIIPFQFEKFPIRAVTRDGGETWFVASDVLATLSLDRKALERLDEDEKGVSSIHTPGGEQDMTVINESGLYSLTLGSRKPEAKRFKRWVTHEVLPSIRKTGAYAMSGADLPVAVVAQIQQVARAQIGGITKAVVNKAIGDALASALPALVATKRIRIQSAPLAATSNCQQISTNPILGALPSLHVIWQATHLAKG